MKQFAFILLATAVASSMSGPNAAYSRRGWTTEWPDLDSPLSSGPERLPSSPDWCTCVDVRACPGARRLLRRDADQQGRRRLLGDVTCGFDGFMPFLCCDRLRDPQVGEVATPRPRRRPGSTPGSGDSSRPPRGRPGTFELGAEVANPRPCPGDGAGGADTNISPTTLAGPAHAFPETSFGHPSMHRHTTDTTRLPVPFNNFFRYDTLDYEGLANGQVDSRRHSFPPGSSFREENYEVMERGDHHMLHHASHVLVPTVLTYEHGLRRPTPTSMYVIRMTKPPGRDFRVNPMPNGDEPPKRRNDPVNSRCFSDTRDERSTNRGYSVRSDFPDANRITPEYATGGDAVPAIVFPTAIPAAETGDSNTIPPEYVRGGDVKPLAPASGETTWRPARGETTWRPASSKTTWRPASSKTTWRPASDETTWRPASSKTTWRPASDETTWRPASDGSGSSSSSSPWSQKRTLLLTEECGVSVDERIVGGKTAALGAFPWIARLGYIRTGTRQVVYRCGGSLISRQHLVTAAHCVTKLPSRLQLVTVRLGELDERTDPDCNIAECADPVQDFVPRRITVHQSYDRPKYKNDIAIIRLDRPVNITAYVSPICLPFDDFIKKNYTGQSVIVAGWGSTGMGLPSSKTLQWVKLKVLPTAGCDATFSRKANVSVGEGQMCAAGDAGKDSCEGDSGGPLASLEQPTLHSMARHVLVGVVSFGSITCATDTVPGVYTHLSSYLRWLLDSIPASEL